MAKVRVIIPETLEKFEFDAGRSKIKRALKDVEGRKIFSKKKTAISRYFVPNSLFELIKDHPQCWLYSRGREHRVWMTDARPRYIDFDGDETIFLPDINENSIFKLAGSGYIPEGKIVACSDVIHYGEGIYG